MMKLIPLAVSDDEGIEGGTQQLGKLWVLTINTFFCSFLFAASDGTASRVNALSSGIADHSVDLDIPVTGFYQTAQGWRGVQFIAFSNELACAGLDNLTYFGWQIRSPYTFYFGLWPTNMPNFFLAEAIFVTTLS